MNGTKRAVIVICDSLRADLIGEDLHDFIRRAQLGAKSPVQKCKTANQPECPVCDQHHERQRPELAEDRVAPLARTHR